MQASVFTLEEAIAFVDQRPGDCTEEFFLQKFNILCWLPKAMAQYGKSLSTKDLGRIISNVCKWDCGKQIFKEMVLVLKDKKVELALCNKPKDLGLNKNIYLLSDSLFEEMGDKKGGNRFLLLLNLSSEPLNSHCRWCALMDIITKKIKIQKLDLKDLSIFPAEGCSAGHEFYHTCTFLRKIDEELNEAEVSRRTKEKSFQELNSFSPLGLMVQSSETASGLFVNGEEMRNLCGIKIEKGKNVESCGEFDFWQKALMGCSGYKDQLVLLLYCEIDKPAPVLSDKGNAILHQLFQVKFPNCPHMLTTNASNILGSDFSNFSLIDVLGDGNCGIIATLVASGHMDEKFSISEDGHLSLTPEQREKMINLRQSAGQYIPETHERRTEISARLIRDGSWIDGGDLSFVARAMQQPIVLIQASTEGRPYTMIRFTTEGNEGILTDQTPEQLLKNDPRTLFIYFNGINHFQALKRNSSESKCLLQ